MSDEPTMEQKGIRGLIAALDVEKPHPSKAALYKSHPTNILTNDRGVPVMPIYRIVEVVLAAIACDTSDPDPECTSSRGDHRQQIVADQIAEWWLTDTGPCGMCGDGRGARHRVADAIVEYVITEMEATE